MTTLTNSTRSPIPALMAVVAGLLIVLGLVVGLWPHHVEGLDGQLSCGSGFRQNSRAIEIDTHAQDLYNTLQGVSASGLDEHADFKSRCDDARASSRWVGFGAIGLGVVSVMMAGVAASQSGPRRTT